MKMISVEKGNCNCGNDWRHSLSRELMGADVVGGWPLRPTSTYL